MTHLDDGDGDDDGDDDDDDGDDDLSPLRDSVYHPGVPNAPRCV